MMKTIKSLFFLLKDTFQDWLRANPSMLAAALAYYAIFSLAPLLVVAVSVTGLVYDSLTARKLILTSIQQIAGSQVAEMAQVVFESASRTPGGSLTPIIGIGVLVYTASILFVKLKIAINVIWGIIPNPRRALLLSVWAQARSILMVFALGLLLILFISLSTFIVFIHHFLSSIPQFDHILENLPKADFWVMLLIFTLFFALVFKTLPEVKISWRDVALGAFVTGLLFTIGEFAIGLYLGRVSLGSTFGAASSVIVFLVWVYYSMQIILFGAQFTQVFANRYGHGIHPANHAVLVVRELKDAPMEQDLP